MGPKCNHRCPRKREAEGALIAAERKEKKVMCGRKQRRGLTTMQRRGHMLQEGGRIRCYTAGCQSGGRGHEPRDTGVHL